MASGHVWLVALGHVWQDGPDAPCIEALSPIIPLVRFESLLSSMPIKTSWSADEEHMALAS